MAKIPLPPDTPAWRKKKVKPEDMPISDAMQEFLRQKSEGESQKRMEDESIDEEKEAIARRGYAAGGVVRGCGKAVKGFGKGKVY